MEKGCTVLSREYERETASPDLVFMDGEIAQVYYPWRRFLSRMLDLGIYRALWAVLLMFVFNVNLVHSGSLGRLD
jgi:hypothetical protein